MCEDLLDTGKVSFDLIKRIKDTPHQTGLSRENRKSNLKGCFEVVGYKKLIRTGNLFFGRYDTVNSKKIKFKCDKHGYSKDLLKFREFCSDRRSGSEIYNLLLSVMGQYNVALEQGHNFSNLTVKG